MPPLQVTEALDSEELKPACIPYNLLQHLCQAPAFIAALQPAIPDADGVAGPGRSFDAVSDAQRPALRGAIHWTACLSVFPAAAELHTAPDDVASSSAEPGSEGQSPVKGGMSPLVVFGYDLQVRRASQMTEVCLLMLGEFSTRLHALI